MYNDRGGTSDQRNAVGAIAEYALARHYGKSVLQDWAETKSYTDGDPRLIPCDVGRNLHVRATVNPSARFLVIHEARGQVMTPPDRRRRRPTDPADGVFVFARVSEEALTVSFFGWRLSGWVQANCEWNTHGPGFFREDRHAFTCHMDDLLPLSEIPKEAIW